jgi:hypothetical protein
MGPSRSYLGGVRTLAVDLASAGERTATASIEWPAGALGLTRPPEAAQREAAAPEGWITLPTGTLADLVIPPCR